MSRTIVNASTGEVTVDEAFTATDFTPPIEDRREGATLDRAAFLLGCVSADIITEAEAEEAADGSWPTSFNAFLAGMTAAQRIEAKAVWASRADIRRNSDLLALVAANKGVTEEELDALFGLS
jgi:hypothetical protein